MPDSQENFVISPDTGFDGPAFGNDDAELLKDQEARQQRFRELDFDLLADSAALPASVRFDSTRLPTAMPDFSEGVPDAFVPGGSAMSVPVKTRDAGMEWEELPAAAYQDDAPLWDSDLSEGYFVDEITAYLAPDVCSDELTREQRALQIAAEVAEDYGWDRAGIAMLADVFGRHWWSASQVAVRRAIEHGMTQRELPLADRVRQMWSERSEFWVAASQGTLVEKYSILTWPAALSLIRSFEGYPDPDEVELMLDSCLAQWLHSGSLQWRFRSFLGWALYRCGARGDMPEFDGWVDFGPCLDDDDELDDVALMRELRSYGLGISPHWQPVSREQRKEKGHARREFDPSRLSMHGPDTEDEC